MRTSSASQSRKCTSSSSVPVSMSVAFRRERESPSERLAAVRSEVVEEGALGEGDGIGTDGRRVRVYRSL
jgi:hypothetical protein